YFSGHIDFLATANLNWPIGVSSVRLLLAPMVTRGGFMFLSSFLRLSAFLFGLLVATAAVAEAEVKVSEKAKNHFRAGLAHLDDPAGPNTRKPIANSRRRTPIHPPTRSRSTLDTAPST
ncbi:MAG TPA: hypothetical protein VIV60_12570, partial [Polyangiaceae bacterium]